jgi:hypothetical protein
MYVLFTWLSSEACSAQRAGSALPCVAVWSRVQRRVGAERPQHSFCQVVERWACPGIFLSCLWIWLASFSRVSSAVSAVCKDVDLLPCRRARISHNALTMRVNIVVGCNRISLGIGMAAACVEWSWASVAIHSFVLNWKPPHPPEEVPRKCRIWTQFGNFIFMAMLLECIGF